MSWQAINGVRVSVLVITAAGVADEALPLDERELALAAAVDDALRVGPAFAQRCPGARLVRVESLRALAEDRQGRLYLRYQHP
jgi:hypothetical protein